MGKLFATSFHWLKQRHSEENEELWRKIKDLIKSITNNSGNYDENCMKIKFNDDDDFPLKKILKVYIVVTYVKIYF